MATAATRGARPRRAPPPETTPPRPVHRDFGLSDADAVDLHYAMLVSRRMSESALKLAFQGSIDVSIPSDGHEAAQIASMRVLRPTDPVYLFYRSLPAAYARGMTAREIFLDYFGAADAPSSGGKNLPGHWAKRELNLMSISGSVATQIPHAVGSALAASLRGEDSVTVAYFGDGGSSKSDFHEGLNFAAVRQLPVILFCENNGLAISVPFEKQSAVARVADRAVGYARTAAQVASDMRHFDPIPLFARYLRHVGLLDDGRDKQLAERADAEVADGVQFAEAAANPPVERAFQDVYTR